MSETYKSRVYTERPAYADYDAPEKFEAIKGIIVHRLIQHPKAIIYLQWQAWIWKNP